MQRLCYAKINCPLLQKGIPSRDGSILLRYIPDPTEKLFEEAFQPAPGKYPPHLKWPMSFQLAPFLVPNFLEFFFCPFHCIKAVGWDGLINAVFLESKWPHLFTVILPSSQLYCYRVVIWIFFLQLLPLGEYWSSVSLHKAGFAWLLFR